MRNKFLALFFSYLMIVLLSGHFIVNARAEILPPCTCMIREESIRNPDSINSLSQGSLSLRRTFRIKNDMGFMSDFKDGELTSLLLESVEVAGVCNVEFVWIWPSQLKYERDAGEEITLSFKEGASVGIGIYYGPFGLTGNIDVTPRKSQKITTPLYVYNIELQQASYADGRCNFYYTREKNTDFKAAWEKMMQRNREACIDTRMCLHVQ